VAEKEGVDHAAQVQKRVQQYVAIRDKLAEAEEDHKKAIAPLIETQNLLTSWLTEALSTAGAQSIKTEQGTVYSSTRWTASLDDPKAFMDFIVANQKFDLLDRRANATAVKAFVEEGGSLPPGAKLNAIRTIGVRRPATK
jgi:hypothetical protein